MCFALTSSPIYTANQQANIALDECVGVGRIQSLTLRQKSSLVKNEPAGLNSNSPPHCSSHSITQSEEDLLLKLMNILADIHLTLTRFSHNKSNLIHQDLV